MDEKHQELAREAAERASEQRAQQAAELKTYNETNPVSGGYIANAIWEKPNK